MQTSIESAGVAPEVNVRNSLHTGDKSHKPGIHPGSETQGRYHQKSKTGVSVALRKGLMSSKKILKKYIDLLILRTCENVGILCIICAFMHVIYAFYVLSKNIYYVVFCIFRQYYQGVKNSTLVTC